MSKKPNDETADIDTAILFTAALAAGLLAMETTQHAQENVSDPLDFEPETDALGQEYES